MAVDVDRENAEHHDLREAVAALLAKRSSEARVRELMGSDTGHDETTWRELAEMGLLGLLVPEELGGAGAGHTELGIVMEEMGRALLCGPYFSTAVLATNLLSAVADDAERAAVLPRIAAGELIVGLAYAEGSSTGVPTPVDTAAAVIDGRWRLTGQKTFVLDAQVAHRLYVLADTDSGPSVFAVETGTADAGAAGLTMSALSTIDQTRKQFRVEFSDVAARPVGEPGSGAESFATALELSGVALVSEQAGGAHHAMRMAVDYAKARYQFGRAIGSFQAVKHMCADMLLEAESAISAARHVASAYDQGAPSRAADLALAQAYCSDAFVTVAATNIQVHGGIGFTWEHPAHLYLRRARTDAQLLGPPASHRERYLQLMGA